MRRWRCDRLILPAQVSDAYIGRVETSRTVFPEGKLSLSYPVWLSLAPGSDASLVVVLGMPDSYAIVLIVCCLICRMRRDHFFSTASDDRGRWGTAVIGSQNQPRGEPVTGVRLLVASVDASAWQRFPVVPCSRSCWWPIHSHLWSPALERFPGANGNKLAGAVCRK